MKKFTVLFFTLLAFLVSNSVALAQDNATKKRPAPIERTHVVEDYLPILGKQMRAQGMRPAKPFFVSAIYYHMQIPQNITNARGWGFAPFLDEKDAIPVSMYNAKVETNSVGFRAGINLLPFMSIFGVYMHTEGKSKFTAVADGNQAMPNGYKLDQVNPFKADTGAIGAALSYGFRLGRVVPFAVINGNYAWTSTDRTDNIIQTLIVGARVGVNVPLPKDMKVAFMLGTQYTYMPMGNQVSGSYTVTLPPGTLVNQNEPYTITSKYKADAEYSSPWTFNAGVMYSVNRYFDILAEVGFLTRLTAMVTLQANF